MAANSHRHQKFRDMGFNFSVYYTVYYIRVNVLLPMDANNVQWLSDYTKSGVSLPIIYEGRPILDTHIFAQRYLDWSSDFSMWQISRRYPLFISKHGVKNLPKSVFVHIYLRLCISFLQDRSSFVDDRK